VVNIGIDRPAVSDKHWIYYPESKFPFYRVGCPSNLSPSMAPEGTSSLSVEISALPSEAADIKKIVNETRQGLYSGSLLSPADPILFEEVRTISRAYVIPNHDYASTVPRLKQCLEEKEIYSIGRYGSWEHSSMEDGLFQGKTVSGRLLALCQK
jgi:UDP-galactopyranose mutase